MKREIMKEEMRTLKGVMQLSMVNALNTCLNSDLEEEEYESQECSFYEVIECFYEYLDSLSDEFSIIESLILTEFDKVKETAIKLDMEINTTRPIYNYMDIIYQYILLKDTKTFIDNFRIQYGTKMTEKTLKHFMNKEPSEKKSVIYDENAFANMIVDVLDEFKGQKINNKMLENAFIDKINKSGVEQYMYNFMSMMYCDEVQYNCFKTYTTKQLFEDPAAMLCELCIPNLSPIVGDEDFEMTEKMKDIIISYICEYSDLYISKE